MKQKSGFWFEFKNMRPALNKMNYVDVKGKNRIADIIFFVGFGVAVLPQSWLSLFYSKYFNFSSWYRLRADYDYLTEFNSEFIPVYFGGMSLQFALMASSLLLRIYFSYKSEVIFFVYEKWYIYIANIIAASIFSGIGAWFFLNVSDFGLSGENSWFQSNPSSSTKGLPQP